MIKLENTMLQKADKLKRGILSKPSAFQLVKKKRNYRVKIRRNEENKEIKLIIT